MNVSIVRQNPTLLPSVPVVTRSPDNKTFKTYVELCQWGHAVVWGRYRKFLNLTGPAELVEIGSRQAHLFRFSFDSIHTSREVNNKWQFGVWCEGILNDIPWSISERSAAEREVGTPHQPYWCTAPPSGDKLCYAWWKVSNMPVPFLQTHFQYNMP